ncbi:MAG TPA: HlyD family type I secretion periplasmic adaptor subunit [Bradyrhizobium sp.]|nr:HlyD family type I secretion periplasmic adaptor subunit [Bradyrhizobium sp.]
MEQAIDACLRPFGAKPPMESERHREGPIEPMVVPPRRQSPPIAPIDPVLMDLTAPAPEMRMLEDARRSAVGEPAEAALPARIESPAAKWIGKCRDGLVTGVAFIMDRDGAAPPADGADDSLLVRTKWGFEHELRVGLRILIIALVLGGGWFAFVPIAGAVVVPGSLVVQSNVKQIQHPTGGVVAEIKARNGARVEAGDLLVRLDATQAKASLQVVTKQLDEIRARMARLSAERDGKPQIEFPAELLTRASEDNVMSLLASEEQLFRARATTRQSQRDLLNSQIAQLTQEISGLDAQVDSKAKQLDLIQGEQSGVQDLYDKRLVPLTRLTSLQRDAARIDGERGQLTSSIAETRAKIDTAKLQIVRIDQDFRAEVVKDLNEAQSKEAELVEHSIAARDQLDRIEIRAPTSGTVNQLSVHTVGGVIKGGETIMEIVPDTDDLQIEARVDPKDIDHVKTGQQAFVRLTAFNQRTTPQLKGSVNYVSADTGHDQQSNKPFYTVRVVLPEEERRRLSGQQLVPGMPTEVFMQTGSRTMLSYIFEPITDQLRRAFVE